MMNGRTVFAIVRFITDNPAERGAVEGEKAIANGFTIEGLIAAAPLRKTELSRRTRRRRRPSGVGAIIFMYARGIDNSTEERETAVKRNPRSAASLLSFPHRRHQNSALSFPAFGHH